MRRALFSVILVAVAIVLVGGSVATGRATKTVEVGDDFFSPSTLKIKQNTTLDFDWVGEDDHNVFKKSGPGKYFDSGNFEDPGVNFSHKFKKPGNYVLGCILHDKMLMDLKVKKQR